MNHSRLIANAKHLLENIKGKPLSVEQRREAAIELAGLMLTEARRCQTHTERAIQSQLARMMNDPVGKAFTTSMTDQCFRSQNPARIADQLTFLLAKFGIPNFLTPIKKTQLSVFRWIGKPLASIMVPLTKYMLRQETRALILPGEPNKISKHMLRRRKEGVRVNLNHLGEAILGEEEAEHRLSLYLADIANPDVEYISVKISTISSQLNLLGWEETLNQLSHRLKKLYRAAKEHHYTLPNGKKVPKFVNLDMEEYRDLHLTVELFRRVLDDAEFYHYSAGIVLQSYLPDSFLIQQELTAWAMRRVASGGAPIKIRIVKGANLAMEKVEASLRGWPQAPYHSKTDVDANFKRMVNYGCEPQRVIAVNLGIASHNLFDIAYALILRTEKKVEKFIGFEMLEGMADHIRRVIQKLSGDMLLYCPAATKEEFQNAVAYLVRRLDENTAPENFLRHTFGMLTGTKEWQSQAALFSNACHTADLVGFLPCRQQNRLNQEIHKNYLAPFENEPDTDWSLPQNRKWAESLIKAWSTKKHNAIPLILGENEIFSEAFATIGEDPSFPGKELYRYILADSSHLETALKTAINGFKTWSDKPLRERMLLLHEIAHGLRLHRGGLIGAMVADTGKTVYEADIEVSEAIDFAEYYRRNVEELHFLEDIRFSPKGPVLVAPPWNFPCSIPAGGIIAALAAGNSVIFKPAPEAVLVGWQLANIFWQAGIGKDVLQFFTCQDEDIGSRLVQDPRIAAIILTGATSTAKLLLNLRPGLDLIAETGGKNAMIITSMADRDLAIKDLIQSAFGHAGQKCSACSLAILESEVYDDHSFRQKLRDAVSSLHVGRPWNLFTRINPLIRPPNPTLMRGLTSLEEGEEWLIKPKQDPSNPNLWSPGIKIGVKPGSFSHQTELFGPVLSIMRADNLMHAVTLANATPYGLTSGIHTLDEREQNYWIKHIEAGNCYINRGITGAVVRRQPFGGIKESSFGPGAKAGGPNYVLQLMKPEQINLPKEREPLNGAVMLLNQQISKANFSEKELEIWNASVGSYSFFWNHYFSKKHDPSLLLGQDNFLYFVQKPLVLRIQGADQLIDILRVIAAALTCRTPIEISCSDVHNFPNLKHMLQGDGRQQIKNFSVITETEDDLIDRVASGKIRRIRLLSPPSPSLQQAFADAACNASITPVLANGRLELLRFLHEISLSIDYHRYGNLGLREGEKRAPLTEKTCGSSCRCTC